MTAAERTRRLARRLDLIVLLAAPFAVTACASKDPLAACEGGPRSTVHIPLATMCVTDGDAGDDAGLPGFMQPKGICRSRAVIELEANAPFGTCRFECATLDSQLHSNAESCSFDVGDAGPTGVACTFGPNCTGRRFEGLEGAASVDGAISLGAYAARAAYLEAASVHAFRWLAKEIRSHGLGEALAVWAEEAAKDEVRHARGMARLARRFGAKVSRVRRPAMKVRPLEAIAAENAVEGCVRETYGAALARWQAIHARDPEVRALFKQLAADETSHAAFSHALDVAVRARLSASAAARVTAAQEKAAAELVGALQRAPGAEVADVFGLPPPRVATALAVAAVGRIDVGSGLVTRAPLVDIGVAGDPACTISA